MTDKRILVLIGPGSAAATGAGEQRFGSFSLRQTEDSCSALCEELGIGLDFRQTDDKNELSRWIAEDSEECDALVINPTRYARDMFADIDFYRSIFKKLERLDKPVIEVHVTNIFREHGDLTDSPQGPAGGPGLICGLGVHGYLLAIRAAVKTLQN